MGGRRETNYFQPSVSFIFLLVGRAAALEITAINIPQYAKARRINLCFGSQFIRRSFCKFIYSLKAMFSPRLCMVWCP